MWGESCWSHNPREFIMDRTHQQRHGPRWGTACQPPNRSHQPQAACSVFLKVDCANTRGSTPTKRGRRPSPQSPGSRKAPEAMGDVQGPALEVLKSELTEAKSTSKQPTSRPISAGSASPEQRSASRSGCPTRGGDCSAHRGPRQGRDAKAVLISGNRTLLGR